MGSSGARAFVKRVSGLFVCLASILTLSGGPAAAPPPRPVGAFPDVDHVPADVAVSWFDLLYDLIRVERLTPPIASRAIGYAGVALHESVVPGVPGGFTLAGQLNGLPPLPRPDPRRKYVWPAVANAAMADTLRGLFPAASQPSRDAIDALEARLANSLGLPMPPPVVRQSVQLGKEIAHEILAWAGGDGFPTLNNCAYTPPTGDGMWVPTPPLFRPPLQPCWGQMRPFVLHDGSECGAPPPIPYSTATDSDFYADAREVYDTTTDLSDEQMAIALFWADNPAETGTPPGHWISITGQVARQRRLSLTAAARAYAAVGIAVADSFISCWETKYDFNLLRPITYIQANIDASWTSPIGTPAFPEYTSGHSVQSAAAARMLSTQLGVFTFTDHTHDARGLPARTFDTFDQAADEAAISRLYGGIHYRAAIERGLTQGRCIGRRILDRVRFFAGGSLGPP